MEETLDLIYQKENQMNHHVEICERQLHRFQQQLRQLYDKYRFDTALPYPSTLRVEQNSQFQEVHNPNRARLDLAAKSSRERERYAEQRERQRRVSTIMENRIYEFSKRRRRRSKKLKKSKSRR